MSIEVEDFGAVALQSIKDAVKFFLEPAKNMLKSEKAFPIQVLFGRFVKVGVAMALPDEDAQMSFQSGTREEFSRKVSEHATMINADVVLIVSQNSVWSPHRAQLSAINIDETDFLELSDEEKSRFAEEKHCLIAFASSTIGNWGIRQMFEEKDGEIVFGELTEVNEDATVGLVSFGVERTDHGSS
jgi:hypothetical protein